MDEAMVLELTQPSARRRDYQLRRGGQVTGSLRFAPRSLRPQHQWNPGRRYSPAGSHLPVPTRSALGRCRASAIRLRAQRLEVLPNSPASLRSDSGLPVWRLAR